MAKQSLPGPGPGLVERLEARQHFSVSLDASGWTVIAPPADAKVIYVSSSQGSDSNTGLTPAAPVRSLAQASSLARNASGDQILLKRGDTWYESFGMWIKSGRSADEPMVIGAYGSGSRPTVASGSATAFGTGRS